MKTDLEVKKREINAEIYKLQQELIGIQKAIDSDLIDSDSVCDYCAEERNCGYCVEYSEFIGIKVKKHEN